MLKTRFYFILLVFAVFVTADSAIAGGMGMGMGDPPCGVGNFPPCPSPVPIDGGIALLAGAGLALGARKMFRKKTV